MQEPVERNGPDVGDWETLNKRARIAGLIYLLVALIAPVRFIYIPSVLFVRGDAGATAGNIAAHPSLFRFGIVTELLAAVLMLFVALALYRLLSDVNRDHATLMVILGGLMITPLGFANAINDAAALIIAGGADFLSAFDKPQRDALVVFFLRLQRQGVVANEMFWGLWLLPLGRLVTRSKFLPRALGVWLIINGFAYLTISFIGLTLPQYEARAGAIMLPALAGEVAFILWLLVKGSGSLGHGRLGV